MIRVILVGGIKIFSLFVFFPQNLIFFVKMLFYSFLKKYYSIYSLLYFNKN